MKKCLIPIFAILLVSMLAFAAGLGGTWNNTVSGSNGPRQLIFTVSGNTLTGTLDGVSIRGGGLSGTSFWFTAARNNGTFQYKGTVTGNSIELHETLNQTNNTYTYTLAGS